MAKILLAPCFDWWLGAHQICFIFVFSWNNEQSPSSVSSRSEFFVARRFPCQLSGQSPFAQVTLHGWCILHIPTGCRRVSNSGLTQRHRAVAAHLGLTSPVWLPGAWSACLLGVTECPGPSASPSRPGVQLRYSWALQGASWSRKSSVYRPIYLFKLFFSWLC